MQNIAKPFDLILRVPMPIACWGVHSKAGGDLGGAIEEYRKAVALEPTWNWDYWLIRALEAKGDKDGAIAVYRAAIRAKPADANLRDRLGTLLREKGDLDAAIALQKEALTNPSPITLRCNRSGPCC